MKIVSVEIYTPAERLFIRVDQEVIKGEETTTVKSIKEVKNGAEIKMADGFIQRYINLPCSFEGVA